MSQRAKIKCGTCSQVLAVDPAAAGKQVQCPKCQARLVVPAGLAVPAAGNNNSETSAASEGTTTVPCGKCQAKLAVKLLEQPSKVQCPKCRAQLNLPARKGKPAFAPNTASAEPPAPARQTLQNSQRPKVRDAIVISEDPQTPVAATPPTASDVPPSPSIGAATIGQPDLAGPAQQHQAGFHQAGSAFDFGGVDLGATSQQPGMPNQGFAGQAYPASRGASHAGRQNGFINWVNRHRFITAILAVNSFAFLVGIFNVPLLVMAAVQLPVAIVIVILLFIPRKHVLDKFASSAGQQFAGMGAGGAALLVVAIIAKGILRGARNQARREGEVDWSSWLDPSSIGAMLGSLFVVAVIAVAFFYLWKLFGIARVLATGYLVEMSFLTVIMIVGGIAKANREAESREFFEDSQRRHQEFVDRAQQHHEEMRRQHEATRSRTFGPSGGPRRFEPSR